MLSSFKRIFWRCLYVAAVEEAVEDVLVVLPMRGPKGGLQVAMRELEHKLGKRIIRKNSNSSLF